MLVGENIVTFLLHFVSDFDCELLGVLFGGPEDSQDPQPPPLRQRLLLFQEVRLLLAFEHFSSFTALHLQVSVSSAVPGAQGHEGGPWGVAGAGDESQVRRDWESDARLGNPQECQSGNYEQQEIGALYHL